MENLIDRRLREADLILVGIGEEMQERVPDDRMAAAYRRLEELLEGKNYFIVSLCMDDRVYQGNLNKDRIVTPCGGARKLQCEDNCSNILYDPDEVKSIVPPVCPFCGKSLVANNIYAPVYAEEGYLAQWEAYKRWLQGTVNRKLCVLELGVGMSFPSIIRWAFEKVVFYNEKSFFVRVHSKLGQLPEEIKERGYCCSLPPVTFLLS